ncbi:ion transporter [uncultured Cytophaga sp.]|uniref:ion transporter n=1 Tax=uncultured Cytophaga sp. TaxID=160238 RepID=UPI00262DF7E0|nr:ion transporter [uncultured Cytophaga sp.]
MATIKATLSSILENNSKNTQLVWLTRIVNYLIVVLVLLNVLAVIFQTEKSLAIDYKTFFIVLEFISAAFFTIEYIIRVWVSNLHRSYQEPFWGRLKYMLTPMAIIDLLSILPFYFLLFTAFDLRFISILRFFRILRIFKLRRYSQAVHTVWQVIVDKKEELIINFATILVLLVISSCLMYYIEHDVQPKAFSSIPATMWWSVSTLTTVGYGDIVPITTFGKLLSACIAMLGIAMFALPAALLSSGFTEQIKNQRRRNFHYSCPHCQAKIDGKDLFNA